jgi:isoquinoline 1-oxidoreductase
MGQGPITSLAQQISDELDVRLESVRMVMGDTMLCPWDMGTWGSLTTREFSHYLRAAGAEARGVLLELGSEYLAIPVRDLMVKEGVIYGIANPKKQVSYGELARGQRIERFLDEKPAVKDPAQFHYVGQSHLHSDSRVKVTGEARFAGDFKLPGMVYAKILRPPSHLSKLESADTTEAENGRIEWSGRRPAAILHPSPEKAPGPFAGGATFTKDELDVDETHLYLPAQCAIAEPGGGPGATFGRGSTDEIIESTFLDGYKAHSPIEPHTALAFWEGEKVTVWASTQNPFGAQEDIAGELDLELENVRVISPFVGGGFGGKSANPQITEAVHIARVAQKPVMVAYTREEEFFMDHFRPAAVVRIRSGISSDGKITLWDFKQYFAGNRGSNTIYNVPHNLTTGFGEKRGEPVHPFATGPWRAQPCAIPLQGSQVDTWQQKQG